MGAAVTVLCSSYPASSNTCQNPDNTSSSKTTAPTVNTLAVRVQAVVDNLSRSAGADLPARVKAHLIQTRGGGGDFLGSRPAPSLRVALPLGSTGIRASLISAPN